MKKIYLFLLFLFIFFLFGCRYNGYRGEYLAFYNEAINSILWNNGHSFSADKYCDPKIEIIDEDVYGRVLFLYYEKYYAGAGISFSSLMFCQKYTDNYVYYYEDVNYITIQQELHSVKLEDFNENQVEVLKLKNDWNKSINIEKCIKKEILKEKKTIFNENQIIEDVVFTFDLRKNEYLMFIDILTENYNKNEIIFYGYIKRNEEEVFFVGIIGVENDDIIYVKYLLPKNLYDYNEELREFKYCNNWY